MKIGGSLARNSFFQRFKLSSWEVILAFCVAGAILSKRVNIRVAEGSVARVAESRVARVAERSCVAVFP